MNINYDINKSKIIDDYYKCIGTFENCKFLFENKEDFIENKEDSIEIQKIKKGRKEDLLSNLGKVGEKAIKYILGLELIKTNPNIDPNSFEAFFRKSNPIIDFAQKHGIDSNSTELSKIKNYTDINNQKAHNFDYWFTIFEVTMKNIYEKFKKYVEYNIQSDMLIKYCQEEDGFTYEFEANYIEYKEFTSTFTSAIFPSYIASDCTAKVPKKQLDMIYKVKRESIKKGGDIFTRLRYAVNNMDGKDFNVEEMYNIMLDFVSFIKMIHSNNDNLAFNLDIQFAKIKTFEFKDLLNIPEPEVEKLFSLNLDDILLHDILFMHGYKTVFRLLEAGIPIKDLRTVYYNNLTAKNIKYFNSIGITDYEQMRKLLDDYFNITTEVSRYEETVKHR